jgi:hypothetical protein
VWLSAWIALAQGRARSNSREAADCYRKVIDFLRQHPDYADPEMAEDYAKLVAKLDPPPAG